MDINILSSNFIEPWDWQNPWNPGIGGSESAHIELANGLHKLGHSVKSFTETPAHRRHSVSPEGVPYFPLDEVAQNPCDNWIIFRDPQAIDAVDKISPGARMIFVAEDTWYPDLTKEQFEKLRFYLCLCPQHLADTWKGLENLKVPFEEIKRRLDIWSNGIRSDYIWRAIPKGVVREKKLFYPSSPDRGLITILQNFDRIRERVPDVKLTVAYGFDNIEKVLEKNPNLAALSGIYDIKPLLNQPGVEWIGRVGQERLIKEWSTTSVWWYPTNFPETSCITCMEAQACGAIPVTTDYWALAANVRSGYLYYPPPQASSRILAEMIDQVCNILSVPEDYVIMRNEMQLDALTTFDWVTQCEKFNAKFLSEENS